MKKFVFICIINCLCIAGFAQQMPNNTLSEWNKINYNPAYSGTSNTTDISFLIRQQWIGFEDAPRNQYISAAGMLDYGIGISGVIFNNVTGPTRQTGLRGGFAKHIGLTKEITLSLALSVDIFQNSFDKSSLHTGLPDDPAIEGSSTVQKLGPDASAGAVLYSHNYYVGFSCTNLTESKYDFLNTDNDFINPISRTFFLNGGYAFKLTKEAKFIPSVLVRKTMGLPFQLDANARLYWKFIIAGLAYRSSNDLSLIVGAHFAQFYEIAYSFDYSFNSIGDYSSGSHELVLCFKLKNSNRNQSSRRKDTIFWN